MNVKEYWERGKKYYNEKNFDGAIADCTEVIKLEPNNLGAYCNRSMAYIQKKEFDLAIADLTEAIRIEPDKYGDFYMMRGVAYSFKGNKDLAISDLEMAVKIEPQNKDYREALEELKSGKTPPTVEEEFRKAERKEHEREERENRERLQKAAEQGDVAAQFGLGLWYFSGQGGLKDYAKAIEWFSKAAAQGHEEAKNYLTKVEECKESEERERKERIQNELRPLKKQITFINVSVLVGLIAGLITGLILFSIGRSYQGEELLTAAIIGAIIGLFIGFYIPAVWPVLKRTWIIARGISSVIFYFLFGSDEGCLVNVIAGFIFYFAYSCVATIGAPINIVVTIVRYFSIRKKIKLLNGEL